MDDQLGPKHEAEKKFNNNPHLFTNIAISKKAFSFKYTCKKVTHIHKLRNEPCSQIEQFIGRKLINEGDLRTGLKQCTTSCLQNTFLGKKDSPCSGSFKSTM
jgi:hypothetical protein